MIRLSLQIWNNKKVYGSGCYATRDGEVIQWNGNKKSTGKRNGTRDGMNKDVLMRSAKRAYIKLVRTAESIGVDRMITLTFAKNITKEHIKDTNKCFRYFILSLEAIHGKIEYIAVPELQKRGAIHYHVGVNKYFNVWELWKLWKQAIIKHGLQVNGDKVGSVFINKKATKCKKGVARYIAKYVFKGVHNNLYDVTGFNGKRYYASKVTVSKVIIDYYGIDSSLQGIKYNLKNVHDIELDILKINYQSVGLFGYRWLFFEATLLEVT